MRRSSRVTVRLSAYSTRNIAPRNHIAAEKLQRQAISANGIAGRRKMSLKPSAVGDEELMLDTGATVPNYCTCVPRGMSSSPHPRKERKNERRMGHPCLRA